jgi:hypothetical protein
MRGSILVDERGRNLSLAAHMVRHPGHQWSGGTASPRFIPSVCERYRGLRNMGTSVGEEPAWIVPSSSKPWRR